MKDTASIMAIGTNQTTARITTKTKPIAFALRLVSTTASSLAQREAGAEHPHLEQAEDQREEKEDDRKCRRVSHTLQAEALLEDVVGQHLAGMVRPALRQHVDQGKCLQCA